MPLVSLPDLDQKQLINHLYLVEIKFLPNDRHLLPYSQYRHLPGEYSDLQALLFLIHFHVETMNPLLSCGYISKSNKFSAISANDSSDVLKYSSQFSLSQSSIRLETPITTHSFVKSA